MIEINTLHTGDSLDLLKQVDDNSIALHFTSPPYADMKQYKDFQGIHPDKYVEWFMPFILVGAENPSPLGDGMNATH